jgi:hypothetical protein
VPRRARDARCTERCAGARRSFRGPRERRRDATGKAQTNAPGATGHARPPLRPPLTPSRHSRRHLPLTGDSLTSRLCLPRSARDAGARRGRISPATSGSDAPSRSV